MLTSRELPRVASHLVRVKSYVEGKRWKREAREGEEGEKKRARLLQLYYFIPRRLPSFPSSRSGILEIVWRRIRIFSDNSRWLVSLFHAVRIQRKSFSSCPTFIIRLFKRTEKRMVFEEKDCYSLSLSIILCSRESHVYYLSYVGFPFYFPRLSQETDDQRRLDTIPSKEHGRIARPWRR